MLQAPPAIMLFVFSVILVVVLNFLKRRTIAKNVLMVLIFFHFTLVLSVTIFPIPLDKKLLMDLRLASPINRHRYIPFMSIKELIMQSVGPSVYIKQVFGNILMCVPFGFLWPFIFKKNSLRKMIVFGVSVGLGIEIIQYILNEIIDYNYRSIDVDDLLLNFMGVVSGYFSFLIFAKIFKYKSLPAKLSA